MINNQYSLNMHSETEIPGNLFPLDTHRIIKARYFLAGKLSKNKDILEIGCGSGIGIKYLAEKAKSYTGGENSIENINFINKNYGQNYNIKKIDAHKMPFNSESFDVVIALAMIYYLNIEEFLIEVKRVLRPNGILFFCTSNHDVPGFVEAPYTTEYYSVPKLNEILSKAGFSVSFQAAFPCKHKNIIVRKVRAYIKNITKFFFYSVPGGSKYWKNMREQKQGDFAPLPNNLSDISINPEDIFQKIPNNKKDTLHRIIYVTAVLGE